MADTKLARARHFVLHTLLHSLFGVFLHPLWPWLWGVTLSALVALWALLVEREPVAYTAMVFAAAFAIILTASIVIQAITTRRLRQALPREPKQLDVDVRLDTEPATDSAGMQQLNEISELKYVIQSCHNFLIALCARERSENSGAIKHVAELIRLFILPPLQEALVTWDPAMAVLRNKKRVNREELHRILVAGDNAIRRCGAALEWITKAGEELHGEPLLGSPDYLDLREGIETLNNELKRAEKNPDVRMIAGNRNALWLFLSRSPSPPS